MPEEFEENTPTNTWRGNVKEEWCDYNGHLNLAYYVVIFDLATDAFYDVVGLYRDPLGPHGPPGCEAQFDSC